ncbi:unnamed protein product [Schistocephalus solidus]|uniref:Uncharacterized protein n=1 Tax=Schistocephalus solidus TaxID=70667 RepID=A0A183T114_SCHSO|nr:unnamed protein product [Schistocephalus solidus]
MELASGENNVSGAAMMVADTLTFQQEFVFQMVVDTIEENKGEDFPGNVEEQDSSLIVTELAVPVFL